MTGGYEALSHQAAEDQGHEADEGMGTDALVQAGVVRRDPDLALEHPNLPLDVGQALVVLHDLGCKPKR